MVCQKASTEIAMKRRVYRIILYTYLGNTGVYVCCNNTFSQVQVAGQGFLQLPLSKLPLAPAHLDLQSLTSMLICLTPHPTPFNPPLPLPLPPRAVSTARCPCSLWQPHH